MTSFMRYPPIRYFRRLHLTLPDQRIQLVIDRTDAAGTLVFYIQHSTDTPPKSQLNVLKVGKVVVTGLVTMG
ncbi:hypothetical protein LLF88_01215 [bacterium]|nr:hypothetical protein [bacterium]